MGRAGRMDAALDRAAALLDGLPRERRALIVAGERRSTLLAPGEPTELLADRRKLLAAPAGPADALATTLAVWLDAREAAPDEATSAPLSGRSWAPGAETTWIAIGAPPSLEPLAALVEPETALELQLVPIAAGTAENDGILAMGLAPASSGAADRADLWLETTGPAPLVEHTRPGSAPTTIELERQGDGARFLGRDVALDGGQVEASLPGGDALAADDRAHLDWPDRGPLHVALGADLDPRWRAALEAVLDADSGLVSTSDAPDVWIVGEAEAASIDLPALVLTSEADGGDATRVGTLTATAGPAAPDFGALFDGLALGLVGTGLRRSDEAPGEPTTRPPSILAFEERIASGPARIDLPSCLAQAPFELTEEREFPLLISLGLRWLTDDGAPADDLRRIMSPDLVGRAVSLETRTPEAALPAASPSESDPARRAELWPALALLAAALLGFEWYLFGTRRIP